MNILIYILIFTTALVFKLWWDYKAKSNGRIINHTLSASIDGAIYLVSAWLLFGWDAGGWIVLAIGFRWLLFDILFNIINDWDWNHYGTSSKLDVFLIKMGKFHLVPKIALILLGIILIIIV